ncbi:tRNA 2-thiouridine-synthesizing protein [Pseudoalteromonas sp. MMG010]|uniref:DsrH/TusB family sulfur metabolism protein n=1 Tax=Pseudoalteromonas sp. MMG010 TaxID=2822685 RepID=UPI001B3A79D1|nr:DsrH/TusB family sulfur metabolism protein [Pseudoalteromonas sp. MMG010]MBQ4832474.1 tRNA 2-thiouridine-synthesizing protein [Pseudoalteromonas sp. MMG010]
MTTLHIFSKPVNYYSIEQLINIIQPHDNILLVSDACYDITQFRQLSPTLLLLEEDALARAVNYTSIDQLISYTEFVDLCVTTHQSITW